MDVPQQYKKCVDEATIILMETAEGLWPIIRELGESFECECGDIVISIRKKTGLKSMYNKDVLHPYFK